LAEEEHSNNNNNMTSPTPSNPAVLSTETLSRGLVQVDIAIAQHHLPVQALAFENSYVFSLTILYSVSGNDWRKAMPEVRLMASPHCEDGAQVRHTITLPLVSKFILPTLSFHLDIPEFDRLLVKHRPFDCC
jgi:hypothetical protein